mmetsp:Transcript_24/g.33  ORF Transcript_24/g.33 Transcript_24/m.33 type:complete len:272 (-) Transcript_24:148-963(-)
MLLLSSRPLCLPSRRCWKYTQRVPHARMTKVCSPSTLPSVTELVNRLCNCCFRLSLNLSMLRTARDVPLWFLLSNPPTPTRMPTLPSFKEDPLSMPSPEPTAVILLLPQLPLEEDVLPSLRPNLPRHKRLPRFWLTTSTHLRPNWRADLTPSVSWPPRLPTLMLSLSLSPLNLKRPVFLSPPKTLNSKRIMPLLRNVPPKLRLMPLKPPLHLRQPRSRRLRNTRSQTKIVSNLRKRSRRPRRMLPVHRLTPPLWRPPFRRRLSQRSHWLTK